MPGNPALVDAIRSLITSVVTMADSAATLASLTLNRYGPINSPDRRRFADVADRLGKLTGSVPQMGEIQLSLLEESRDLTGNNSELKGHTGFHDPYLNRNKRIEMSLLLASFYLTAHRVLGILNGYSLSDTVTCPPISAIRHWLLANPPREGVPDITARFSTGQYGPVIKDLSPGNESPGFQDKGFWFNAGEFYETLLKNSRRTTLPARSGHKECVRTPAAYRHTRQPFPCPSHYPVNPAGN